MSDRPIPRSYWVKPGSFLAGEYPGHEPEEWTQTRFERFRAAGVTAFLDLTEEGELLPYDDRGFPHGKLQFISFAGTAWAVMALAYAAR